MTEQEMELQIEAVLKGKNENDKSIQANTVFEDLLNSKLPPQELSHTRLLHEAQSVIGAGFETTTLALTNLFYHILANPDVYERLKEELRRAIPNPDVIPSWSELQALPYLSACVEEGTAKSLPHRSCVNNRIFANNGLCPGLRLSYGVAQRSPRVSHDHAFEYEGWLIPPRTPVSQDSFHMHHHEEIFPNSDTYKPERWLDNPKGPDGVKQLSRYMVTFGRGSRICLGMNIAYAEIYIATATVLRRLDFSLFDTDKSNVEFFQEFLVPQPRLGSLGVRVLVK